MASAFGSDTEDQRRHKQVLRHLIRKVLGSRFEVIRADEIDEEGLITHQIIEHLLEDDLVVADLTGLNPNVLYEVAVRHAVQKPIVHLITAGEEIPFDIANMRAVSYALDDPDLLEAAQEELDRKVKAIEAADWVAAPNPISAAKNVSLLQESEQPEVRAEGDLLAAVNELRDEVRTLRKREATSETGIRRPVREAVMGCLLEKEARSISEISKTLGVTRATVAGSLSVLLQEGRAGKNPDGSWSAVTFQPRLSDLG